MSGDEETLSGVLGGKRFQFPCVFYVCIIFYVGWQRQELRRSADGVAGRSVNEWLSHAERSRGKDIRGLEKNVKTLSHFNFFPDVICFFSSYRLSKRWLHTLIEEFTWARKGKRKRNSIGRERKKKGKGKGTEKEKDRKKERRKRKSKGRERKRKGKGEGKKKAVSHTDNFWCQKLSFSLSFCHHSWILCVCVRFFWKWLHSSTYQAPSFWRIYAITTTNNERKRPKALNSCRMMGKKLWIPRVRTRIINITNVIVFPLIVFSSET